jgi:drug/metabolite transporter (DMT)-like permease
LRCVSDEESVPLCAYRRYLGINLVRDQVSTERNTSPGLRDVSIRVSDTNFVRLVLVSPAAFAVFRPTTFSAGAPWVDLILEQLRVILRSRKHLVSGSVAVIFSLLVVFNILIGWLLFGSSPDRQVMAGAVLGLLGIVLTFWQNLATMNSGSESFWGIVLSLAATLIASLGNLASSKLPEYGIPVIPANAFGMLYGTASLLAYSLLSGAKFSFDTSTSYIVSLAYLALFGSVIAFSCYLTLIGRIGPDRAAYTSILFPIVALFFSVAFEGYQLNILDALGIACVLAGNGLVLLRRRTNVAIPIPIVDRPDGS